ncbi:MAG: hypothetical protein GY816_13005 [Cytophagales bacterium]|nr:hypothetical protein [Cytophagales bacterium]
MRFITISTLSLMISCGFFQERNADKNEITVKRSYIEGTDFITGIDGGIRISEISLLDSTISVESGIFSSFDLLEHSVIEEYMLTSDGAISIGTSKIYFNKPNEGRSWIWVGNGHIETIDKLNLDSWYLIRGLRPNWQYYVYVDSLGETHTFSLNPHNW